MRFEETDNMLTCIFSGDQNSETSTIAEPELIDRVNAFMQDRDRGEIAFDLAEVAYVSSAFLRLCLWCCKRVGNRNFSIRGVSPELLKVFQIAGFVEMMNVGA